MSKISTGTLLNTGFVVTSDTSGNLVVQTGASSNTAVVIDANGTVNFGYTTNFSSPLALNGGTANGVSYLNASKVLTTGNVLTFDGTTLSAAGLSVSDNLTFTGTGKHILGDMRTGIVPSSRLLIKTSTGTSSDLGIIPNATSGAEAAYTTYSSSNPDNASAFAFGITSGGLARINSTITGTGTYLPMTFYTGGSERVRIDTAGNVGIGTNSPSAPLDVNGTIKSRGGGGEGGQITLLNPTNTADGAVFDVDASSNLRLFPATNGASTIIGSIGTTGGTVQFYIAQSERMRIDGSGNVGIGTNSPANIGAGYPHLEVNGSSTGIISVSVNGVRGISLAADGNVASIQARVSGQPLSFSTNNAGTIAERLRIDSTGKLLVGTSSAIATSSASLQVAGAGVAGSISFSKTDVTTSGGSITGIDSWGYDGTTTAIAGTINFRAAENWSSTNHGSDIQFRTTASGSGGALFEAMRLTSAGNLGIGTSSPFGAASRTALVVRGNSNGSEINIQSTTATNGTSDGFALIAAVSDAYIYNRLSGGVMVFGTSNTERARITGSGDLIVGATVPYGKVTSYTNFGNNHATNYAARALGTAAGQLAGYTFHSTFQNIPGDTGPRRSADIWSGYNGSAWGTEFLAFGVGKGGAANDVGDMTNERMRIDGAGNLLVGMTSSNGYQKVSWSGSNSGDTSIPWANVGSIAINMATLFPALNVASGQTMSFMLQIVTSSSASSATSSRILCLRRGDSTWYFGTVETIGNGATVTPSGSSNTITLTFSGGGQYGMCRVHALSN